MNPQNTNVLCPKCGMPSYKNGFVNGKQRFKCQMCDYQFIKQGKIIIPRRLSFSDKLQILHLSQRTKHRQIERELGINRTTVKQIVSDPLRVFIKEAIINDNTSKIRYIGVFTTSEYKEQMKKFPLKNKLILIFEDLCALFEFIP